MSDRRGLVIGPDIEYGEGNRFTIRGSGPRPEDLRFYLLYWDRVDYPRNRLFEVTNDEIGQAESLGVLTRTHVDLIGTWAGADVFIASQWGALRQHERNEPGLWSLAQASDRLIATADVPIHRSVEVELHKLLPCVPAHVAIEDVLEFRIRNADRLSRLREELDSIYLRISNATDQNRAKAAAMAEIRREVTTLREKMTRKGWRTRIRSVRVSLDAQNILSETANIGLAAALNELGFPVLFKAFVGSIRFSLADSPGLDSAAVRASPYGYALQAASTLRGRTA